ncbi:hypothetical protein KIPB_014073, partial [Kipferlia bialata]|eukprot:g14073.t1
MSYVINLGTPTGSEGDVPMTETAPVAQTEAVAPVSVPVETVGTEAGPIETGAGPSGTEDVPKESIVEEPAEE